MKNSHYAIEYSDDKVSAWGGFSVMQQFTEKMQLREFIKTLPLPQSASNNRYEAEELVESFLLSVWLGCYKFSHTHVLRMNDTLKKYSGGSKYRAILRTNAFSRSSIRASTTKSFLRCNAGSSSGCSLITTRWI